MLLTKTLKYVLRLSTISLLVLLSACSEADQNKNNVSQKIQNSAKENITNKTAAHANTPLKQSEVLNILPTLNVYKSATCLCCEAWITHIDQHGFTTNAENVVDLAALKQSKLIAPRYRSCHTAVSEQGYIFEGHVPAKFIAQFLATPEQDALGLAVPAMPVGSPGMEMGDKFMPYQVLLLRDDGSHTVYAHINRYEEQF